MVIHYMVPTCVFYAQVGIIFFFKFLFVLVIANIPIFPNIYQKQETNNNNRKSIRLFHLNSFGINLIT